MKENSFENIPTGLISERVVLRNSGNITRLPTRWSVYRPWRVSESPQNGLAVELYDHESDPDENINVAQAPRYEAVVNDLATKLQKGWRGALPPKTANSENQEQ